MADLQQKDDGSVSYHIPLPVHGAWTHESPLGNPPGVAPTLTNCELFGDLVRSALGNKKFITTAWPSGTITFLSEYRVPAATTKYLVGAADGSTGTIWVWNSGGGTWDNLRTGFSGTQTIWWAKQMYGTDLFITNSTDGVYRYDGTNLLPIGSKLLAQTDTTTDWTNATLDSADFIQGLASVKVQSGNPGASAVLTYNPATAIDGTTGRLSAPNYAVIKTGSDFYHFTVKFDNGAGSTITAATTTFVVTDTSGKSLTFDATKWRSALSPTAAAIPLNDNNWHNVWCLASDGTEVATFNSTSIDKFEWKVTTSAGQTFMKIDDVYETYDTIMPNVSYLGEWRNILFGASTLANRDSLFWSATRAPDQFDTLATAPVKGGGDSITALHSFFHQLTIGTDHHIITLSGNIIGQQYPAYLFDLNEVTDECGISSHRSVVKVNNKLYFFYGKDLMAFNGTGVSRVGYGIEPTLRTFDFANLQFIVGDRDRQTNQIWWTVRINGQSTNTLVIKYDFQHEALLLSDLATPWLTTVYDSGVQRLLSVDNTNRFVYRQYDDTPGYQHFGTNITYTIELTPQGLGDLALDWIEALLAYVTNTGNLTIKYRLADHLRALAGTSYQTLDTVNQAAAGELGRIRLGFPGKVMQLRIEATGIPFALQFPVIIRAREQGLERVFP